MVIRSKDVPAFSVERVEGGAIQGKVEARKLIDGQYGLLLEVAVAAGMRTPAHRHRHDSFLYVLSGRVRATVDGDMDEAGPGDAIFHPAGAEHVSEALEDSRWIELKAPAEETW